MQWPGSITEQDAFRVIHPLSTSFSFSLSLFSLFSFSVFSGFCRPVAQFFYASLTKHNLYFPFLFAYFFLRKLSVSFELSFFSFRFGIKSYNFIVSHNGPCNIFLFFYYVFSKFIFSISLFSVISYFYFKLSVCAPFCQNSPFLLTIFLFLPFKTKQLQFFEESWNGEYLLLLVARDEKEERCEIVKKGI